MGKPICFGIRRGTKHVHTKYDYFYDTTSIISESIAS
jgi:hypothetical protein